MRRAGLFFYPRMDEAPGPAVPESGELIHAVRRGTRTVLLTQIASQVTSLVVLAVMMRLVAPEDYGLLGMAIPAIMLPRMAATLGLSTAVMQRDLSHGELSSLFWLNLLWGLVAAAATVLCGPLLAETYRQPMLTYVCAALAGSTLVAAFGNQHQSLLERKLLLGPLSAARLIAQIGGGLAGIYAARRGAGVWALVAQQYSELVALAVWVWLIEPWRPGWPQRGGSVGGLLRFSGYYSLSQLVYFVAQNLDKVMLPVLLGPAADRALGLYSQAFNLMMKPVYLLTSPLTGVMVAGLSKSKDDPAQHAAIATRFFRLVGIGLFPCAAGLFVVGPDLMPVLGSLKWQASGWILAALAPALLVQGLVNIAGHVFASAGRSGRLLFGTTLLLMLLVPGCLCGFYLGRSYFASLTGNAAIAGTIGVAAGYSVVMLALWSLPYLWFCLRTVRLEPRAILRPLLPSLLAALAMGMTAYGLRILLVDQPQVTQEARLVLLIIAGALLYGVFAIRELAWCWRELATK